VNLPIFPHIPFEKGPISHTESRLVKDAIVFLRGRGFTKALELEDPTFEFTVLRR